MSDEALKLADKMCSYSLRSGYAWYCHKAGAELRRLHSENEQLKAQPAQEPVGGTREAFEKWAKSLPNYMDITRFEAGYSDCNTDYAWAGWQAAQPAQEPVGKFAKFTDGVWREVTDGSPGVSLYTAPIQRPWVGIPEEDLKQGDESFFVAWREGARWADAYLKEKNT